MRAAVILALCVAAACGTADRDPRCRPAGQAAPRPGGTLRVAITEEVRSLDPTFTQDEATAYATHALFATLVDLEPASPTDPRAGLRLVPGLAERWTISPDGRAYTFTLRPGLTYSDGTPVAADHVRAALEHQLRTPSAPYAALLADVEGADAVTSGAAPHARGLDCPDARTLAIRLARPNAALLGVMAMVFTTPQPPGRAPDRAAPLGTGPFALGAWDEGRRLVLVRNPRYWDAAHVYLGAVELREHVPRDVQFLAFERGELDAAAHLDAPDALWLQAQPAWAPYLRRRATLTAFGARMNVRVPPFDDRRVRQAFNYALDKEHVRRLLQGTATPAHGVLPPGLPGRDEALAPYPHDPARARALLAAAGHPDGLDVEYLVLADDEALRLAASFQSDLAEIGVRARLRPVPFPTWVAEQGSARGAPFAQASWLYDFADPANALDALFHSGSIADEGSQNVAFYASAELDALLDHARGEPDATARAALYQRAERLLYDDAPWVWGYHQDALEVVQPYVAGYAPHPVWVRDFTHTWLDVGADGAPVPR